jgi:hypothetical protein
MDYSISAAHMDFAFTIIIGNKGAFLAAVASQCLPLSEAINSVTSNIQIMESVDRNKITFITKAQEKKQWEKEFHSMVEGSNIFVVPHFELSDALKQSINAIEDNKESTIGCFKIIKGTGDSKDQTILRIEVPVESMPRWGALTLKLNQKIESSSGIYKAFLGLEDYCGLPYIDVIKLKLESEGGFTEKGAGVVQLQFLNYKRSCRLRTGKPSILTVKSLDGTLFLDAAIAVMFSGKSMARAIGDIPSEFYIDLKTINLGTPVRLYPEQLNSQQALYAAVQYVDPAHHILSSSAPQAALPWQAASAAPHGGAGASSDSRP